MSDEKSESSKPEGKKLLEGLEGLRSYLRKARSKEEVTPTDYRNPYTRQPFETEEELFDYWADLLERLPPEKDLGPNPS